MGCWYEQRTNERGLYCSRWNLVWLVTLGGHCDGGQHAWPTMALSGMEGIGPESSFNWEKQGSRDQGHPLLLPAVSPKPPHQSCSSSLAPAPWSQVLTPQWCMVLYVLLSTSESFLLLVVTSLKGHPPLPQNQLPSCPVWAGVNPSLVEGHVFQSTSPVHKAMAMWQCSGFSPTLLLTVVGVMTSLCLVDCLIACSRKDWEEGSNIYPDFKSISTSNSSNRNVAIFQCYISFMKKKDASFSGFFQWLKLSLFSDKRQALNKSSGRHMILPQPCRWHVEHEQWMHVQ